MDLYSFRVAVDGTLVPRERRLFLMPFATMAAFPSGSSVQRKPLCDGYQIHIYQAHMRIVSAICLQCEYRPTDVSEWLNAFPSEKGTKWESDRKRKWNSVEVRVRGGAIREE